MLRADRKVNELADFLERNRTWIQAGTKSLADHLNGIGLWNLVSERDDIRKPWTEDSLRKPLKKARELLVTRVEDDDDDDIFPGFDHVEMTGEEFQAETPPSRLDIEVCEQRQVAADKREVEDYEDDPRFGIF